MIEFFKEGTAPTLYSTEIDREMVKKQKEVLKELSEEMKRQKAMNN
jgi:hypothetical protein